MHRLAAIWISARLFFFLSCYHFASASTPPPPIPAALREKVDAIVRKALTDTGIPSASIAIVQSGAITYLQAYGDGRIEPHTPALPSMRYSIGSISKQFTAAAVLLLAGTGQAFARRSRVAIRSQPDPRQ